MITSYKEDAYIKQMQLIRSKPFYSFCQHFCLILLSLLLVACGGGISDVDNNHPSQGAPTTSPDITVERNAKNELIVQWQNQASAGQYRLFISSSEGFEPATTSVVNITESPYVVDSLISGTQYYVKLQPLWGGKSGPESNSEIFIAPPLAPTDLSSDETTITWQGEADSYKVYWSTESGFKLDDAEGSQTVDQKSYEPDLSDFTPGTDVHFIVVALDGDNESPVSEQLTLQAKEITNLPILSTNSVEVVENAESATIVLTLSEAASGEASVDYTTQDDTAVANEDYVASNGTITFSAGETEKTISIEIVDNTLFEEQETFTIEFSNVSGATLQRNQTSVTIDDNELASAERPLAAPAKPRVRVTDGSFKTWWESIENADSYTVYMAQEPGITAENIDSLAGKMVHTGVVDPTETQDSAFGHGLVNGEIFYIVVASNAGVDESYGSAELAVKPKASQTGVPQDITIEANVDQNILSWSPVEGATSYNVYWSTEVALTPDNGQLLQSDSVITETSVIHGGLQHGVMYYYIVTANHETGESDYSAQVGATPYGALAAPTNIMVIEGDQQLTLSWDDQPGAVAYHVYRAQDDTLTTENASSLADFVLETENVTNPYLASGLTNNETYYFRVVAIDKYTRQSEQSSLAQGAPHGDDPPPSENLPPVVEMPIEDQTVDEDAELNFAFANTSFSDPEGEVLTYRAIVPDGNEWLSFLPGGRQFIGTPLNANVGSIDIQVVAEDTANQTVTDSFTLIVNNINDTPEAGLIPNQSTNIDELYNYQIPENTFTDPDIDDVLLYSAKLQDGSNLPAWLTFDAGTQTFSGTPLFADVGQLSIIVTATDLEGAAASSGFDLQINGDPGIPVAVNDQYSVDEGTETTLSILDNDKPSKTLTPLDPNSIQVTTGDGFVGSYEVISGKITYTHDGSETTSSVFSYTVADMDGVRSGAATVSVIINPVNDPPEISGTPSTQAPVAQLYSFTPSASDAETASEDLRFSIINQPTWADFDDLSGTLSGTPTATDYESVTEDIVISVSDGELEASLAAFTITVTGIRPIANVDTDKIIAAGNSVTIDVLSNDTFNSNPVVSGDVQVFLVDLPTNGDALVNTDNTITYTGTLGSTSGDTFTYLIEDTSTKIRSLPATVTIQITPWESTDIGIAPDDTANQGSMIISSDGISITGGGSDIWDVSDQFHYAYKQISGDFDVSVNVQSIVDANRWVKAGIMVRESLAADSKHAHLLVTDNSLLPTRQQYFGGAHLQGRINTGEISHSFTQRYNGHDTPHKLRMKRRGNTIEAFESADNGLTWQHIGAVNLPMNDSVFIGLAVTSHVDGSLSTATFNQFSLINQPLAAPQAELVTSLNLNNQTLNGNAKYYHVTGLEFGKLYSVNLTSIDNQDLNLQVFQDAFNTLECYGFDKAVTHDACVASTQTTNELFIHVDGSYAQADSGFNLNLTPWSSQDINTSVPGADSETEVNFPEIDTYTMSGSGRDIYLTVDGFRYWYQPINGNNLEVVAKVISQENTNNWAKAGVMIRESLAADSKFVDVVVTPAPLSTNGVRFQARSATGGQVSHDNTRTNQTASPRWVKLVRLGNAFDAYESANGRDWLYIGTTNVSMPSDVTVGFAVTSHDDTVLSEVVFSDLKVTNITNPVRVVEPLTLSELPQALSVDKEDRYFKISGLTSGTNYTVSIGTPSDDADLYVFTDEFQTLVCPTAGLNPTAVDECNVTAESNTLFVRVNGSYTSNGADFELSVTPQ